MDLTTLRVFDAIHKIGLSEKDYAEIGEEQKHEERTGVYIQFISAKNVVIGVAHDENHKIFIEDFTDSKIRLFAQSRILLKTLITFADVPEQIFILHSILQYRSDDEKVCKTAHTLEELKEIIVERFADGYKQYRLEDAHQLETVYWLFDEPKADKIYSRLNVPRIIKVWSLKNKRLALFQEIECYEDIESHGYFHKRKNVDKITYYIKTYTPKDKEYNYVSPNREVGLTHNSDYQEVWLSDELFEKVEAKDLPTIQHILSKGTDTPNHTIDEEDEDDEEDAERPLHTRMWLLYPDKFAEMQRTIRLTQATKQRTEEEEDAQETLIKNIRKQFAKGKVVREGIIFTKNSIEYEGIKLQDDTMSKFIVANNIIQLQNINFNNIIRHYIQYVLEIKKDTNNYGYDTEKTVSKLTKEKNIEINNIKINIKATSRGIIINNKRIAKDEVEEVLNKIINYTTQTGYDKYLEEIQKVSLKMLKILSQGYFQFEIAMNKNDDCKLDFKTEKLMIHIPVIREKKNYVIIKNKQLSIKNTPSFLKLDISNNRDWRYEGSSLQRVINQLNKSVNNITAQDISTLLIDGMARYKQYIKDKCKIELAKLARSKEFLANAVKVSKAKTIREGYLVTGLSGTIYAINSKTLAVYTKKCGKDDKYLCIVEDYETEEKIDADQEKVREEWKNNDKIAKRLLMLSHDIKVAKDIYQNGDKMDKHWIEILREEQKVTI